MVIRWAVVLALFGACTSAQLVPPQLRVRRGPVDPRFVRRVVAVPATCGTMLSETIAVSGQATFERCPTQGLHGIDQAIRAWLDVSGFQVIDTETLNTATATRREVRVRHTFMEMTRTERHVSLFEDATPSEQRDILRTLGADALVNTRVLIGHRAGLSGRRTIVVQVRLRSLAHTALVWARRCELEVGGLTLIETDIERATRCALEGAP